MAKSKPLTKKQRNWILARDNYQSQLRTYNEKDGWTTKVAQCQVSGNGCPHLHVHHIKSRRAGGTNDPSNLLTIPSCVHTGRCPSNRIRIL